MSKSNHEYQIVTPEKSILAEGPVWDANKNTICWIDILGKNIHEFSTEVKQHRKIPVDDLIGNIVLCQDGNYLAGLQKGIVQINRLTGENKLICQPEKHLPENRFNDGKCDPAGRYWAGTMPVTEDSATGSLYMFQKDLTFEKKIKGVTISNGLAWSPDQKTLYFIDSPTLKVVAFDYDNITGEISNRRIAISIEEKEGFPDGMTIDTEGKLWIAHWDGWQVARWDPQTGKKLLSIRLPVARVSSCTFGGTDLGDLYITSARARLTELELQKQPMAGSLFVIKNTGYKGMPTALFPIN